MENLSFDTGRVTMSINGDASRTISFNPTDPDIVNRFLLLADTCEKKEKEFEKKVEETNRKAINGWLQCSFLTASLKRPWQNRIHWPGRV